MRYAPRFTVPFAVLLALFCLPFISAAQESPENAPSAPAQSETGSIHTGYTGITEEPGDIMGERVQSAAPVSFSQTWEAVYRERSSAGDMNAGAFAADEAVDGERKSGFLAVVYSLVLPGMGELYAGRFDKGKYPLIVEGGLWLGLIGVNSYGSWIEDDARIYAVQHAGIDPSGKDDKYFVNIENYSDLADYNNQRLVERRLDELYPDEQSWRWAWDSESSRLEYKDQRIKADEMHNAVTFFVLGMIANRIWSAIQAGISVKQYNASLAQRLLRMPDMHAQLTSLNGRTDGMQLTFSW